MKAIEQKIHVNDPEAFARSMAEVGISADIIKSALLGAKGQKGTGASNIGSLKRKGQNLNIASSKAMQNALTFINTIK